MVGFCIQFSQLRTSCIRFTLFFFLFYLFIRKKAKYPPIIMQPSTVHTFSQWHWLSQINRQTQTINATDCNVVLNAQAKIFIFVSQIFRVTNKPYRCNEDVYHSLNLTFPVWLQLLCVQLVCCSFTCIFFVWFVCLYNLLQETSR